MSEFSTHIENRIITLENLVKTIINKENPGQLIIENKNLIETVTPYEIIEVESKLLDSGISVNEIKQTIGKVVNVLYKGLKNYKCKSPKNNSFLHLLMKENAEMEKILNLIKKELVKISKTDESTLSKNHHFIVYLKENVSKLKMFICHYIKKENILFPYLEKAWKNSNSLKVMWSIDDDIKEIVKNLEIFLNSNEIDKKELNIKLGQLFFTMLGMKVKEEVVVFKRAMETLNESEFNEMLIQSEEFDYFIFDKTFDIKEIVKKVNLKEITENIDGEVNLETGRLNIKELIGIFNSLPVDITFVDKFDKVKYFSTPKERIFPRAKAIIGREVQNCHPPESLHVVQEIIDRFRNGTSDSESFWINMNNKFILIQYYAIRDCKNEYLGTLEVSMDATNIRSLTGEKRLLSEYS